jgi:hypothetical protein
MRSFRQGIQGECLHGTHHSERQSAPKRHLSSCPAAPVHFPAPHPAGAYPCLLTSDATAILTPLPDPLGAPKRGRTTQPAGRPRPSTARMIPLQQSRLSESSRQEDRAPTVSEGRGGIAATARDHTCGSPAWRETARPRTRCLSYDFGYRS